MEPVKHLPIARSARTFGKRRRVPLYTLCPLVELAIVIALVGALSSALAVAGAVMRTGPQHLYTCGPGPPHPPSAQDVWDWAIDWARD
jgi:hypothetical protein